MEQLHAKTPTGTSNSNKAYLNWKKETAKKAEENERSDQRKVNKERKNINETKNDPMDTRKTHLDVCAKSSIECDRRTTSLSVACGGSLSLPNWRLDSQSTFIEQTEKKTRAHCQTQQKREMGRKP